MSRRMFSIIYKNFRDLENKIIPEKMFTYTKMSMILYINV